MPMKTISWGEAFRVQAAAFVTSLIVFALAWLLFAEVLDAILPAANAAPGTGATVLVLGMVVEMVVAAIVTAASVDAPLVDADSGRGEYSRARVSIEASLIAYGINIAAWYVIAAILVWNVWNVPAYAIVDPVQGFLSLNAILVYFVARQFGTATWFWMASALLYAAIATVALKVIARGRVRAPKPRKKPRGGRKW